MTEPSKTHNELTQLFMNQVVKRIIREGGSQEDVMILFESITTGMLMLLNKYYNVSEQDSAFYVEEVMNSAMARFAKKN